MPDCSGYIPVVESEGEGGEVPAPAADLPEEVHVDPGHLGVLQHQAGQPLEGRPVENLVLVG